MTRLFRRGRPAGEQGFTLIELIVVMTIIAILAGGVTYYSMGQREKAKQTRAVADIKQLEMALDTYSLDNGDPPTTEQGLPALITKPTTPPVPNNWQGPYLRKGLPLVNGVPADPWGNLYQYEFPGKYNTDGYDLASWGKDGQPDGEGYSADLTNWGEEGEAWR